MLIIQHRSFTVLRLRGCTAGGWFRATHADAQHCTVSVSRKFFLSAPWSNHEAQEKTLNSDSTGSSSVTEGRFIRVRFAWADRL